MMKFVAVFALFAVAASRNVLLDPNLDEYWKLFKRVHIKTYGQNEETVRRLIWQQKVADIIQHNLKADLGLYSYRMGLNEFSDMDHKEFVSIFNGYRQSQSNKNSASHWVRLSHINVPNKMDWRDHGLVTPVKNQGLCGSCWAFSTTGSLEGQHKKKTGELVSLSEQNLVDCSRDEGNKGCDGGIVDAAFTYIRNNDGVDTEASYPYTGKNEKCHFNRSNVGATCTGYVDIPSGNETALLQAVATIGPISVAIDASKESFQSYRDGVYDEPDCSSTELDHAVLIVGYGIENGNQYWLVKNSWGETWGVEGYIKMSRNKDNQCGIATVASYPLV